MLVDHHSARRVRERLDAQNEHDGAGAAQLRRSSDSVAAAAPSQQRLRRSSSSVAAELQPSTQLVVSSSRPSSRCCWQHFEKGRGGTSRRDKSCAQHQLRRSSISSVAAASAPSQQHQLRRSSISRRRQCPATMSGRR